MDTCHQQELIEHAQREFFLDTTPKGSKATNRDHLEQVERATGKTPEKLRLSRDNKPVLLYLWYAYLEVMSSQALTYQELDAWCRMTSRKLTPVEVRLLKRLDRVNPFIRLPS